MSPDGHFILAVDSLGNPVVHFINSYDSIGGRILNSKIKAGGFLSNISSRRPSLRLQLWPIALVIS